MAWIFYAGQDIINFSGNENPERLFGQEDGRVFILNRSEEIDISATDFQLQPRLAELYQILESRMLTDEKMIVSEKKAHIVIEKTQPIDNERIRELFEGQPLLEITSKKFQWKDFTLERNKGVLEMYIAAEKTANTSEKWYTFDQKSACSIVQFNNGKPIITDYYQKNGTISLYSRAPLLIPANKSVSDKETFANHIPVFLTYYQFIERDYAMRNDAVFQESVANKWANQGMVFFEYKESAFLLMDFVRGKEPDLFLDNFRDLEGESNRHYIDLAITKNFPNNPKSGFYMKLFDDQVLFAENEQALLDLEASLEMGQMLSLNRGKCQEIFDQTPKSVCYREWSSELKMAKSMYNGSALTVEVRSAGQKSQPKTETAGPTGSSMDGQGKMLLVHPHRDLQYALSESNNLFAFSKSKPLFKKPIDEIVKGEIQWLDKDMNKVVLTSLTKLHVIDEKGAPVSGFPVVINQGISKEVTIFDWKGKSNFLVATNGGNYIWLDANGKQVATGKMEITTLLSKPVVWTSQKRLFFGFQGDGKFAMIEAERGKLLRQFTLPNSVHPVVLSNEIVFYSLENKVLMKYNQQGKKSELATHPNASWLKVDRSNDGSFYVLDGTVLTHYSSKGTKIASFQAKLSNMDFIMSQGTTAKGPLVVVLNDIDNQITVFNDKGKILNLENNNGQSSVGVSTFNGQTQVYTLSDKFVIHYVL